MDKNIEMNIWQSNLMVSLGGTDLGVMLGKSNDWQYNLQIGQQHWGKCNSQFSRYSPTTTITESLWAMERRILAPAFSHHVEIAPLSPVPSSATSVPHISCISNESCYGHTNHAILKKTNLITSPLQGHNNAFVFWAHLQVWTRLLKEIWMPH